MICLHENSEIILISTKGKLQRCVSCGLVRAVKEKSENAKEVYANYYAEETGERFGFGVEYIVRVFRFIRAYKIFFLQPKRGSILDIGSGRGWMLYYLKKYFGYEKVVGTQISENAYRFSKEKLKLEIHNQDLLEIYFAEKFEVVTLWHVLEHVANPEMYVKRIHGLLEKRGMLLIEVPNLNSWSWKLTRQCWLALDWKHHLTFFTPETLSKLLRAYNFEIKKIRTFSLEYSTFTSTQSIINFITKTDAYFFESLQAGRFNLKIIWHSFLFVILFPPCLLVNLLLYFSKSGEVITIIATKND